MENKKKITQNHRLKIGDTVFYAAVGRMLKVAGFEKNKYCDVVYLADDRNPGSYYMVERSEIKTISEIYGI